jgi:hypothetical protein
LNDYRTVFGLSQSQRARDEGAADQSVAILFRQSYAKRSRSATTSAA